MKILLATDGAPQATVALETAAELLRTEGVEFDLLCVAPEFTPPKAIREKDAKKRSRMIESYRERIRVEAHEILARAQASLAARGIEAGMRTEIGSPARVIIKLADDYDLIVVGALYRYTRRKQGLGPTATRVVASAPNDVLIGRGGPGNKVWKVLVAVDGSLASERALNLMVANFNVQASEITVMSVVETPWVHLGLGRKWFVPPKEIIDRAGGETEVAIENELNDEAGYVAEVARLALERRGLSATTMITEGDPAREIISEAKSGGYDLIVMGATGESDLKHDILGSVSTKVAHNAPCSVFVAKFAE